MFRTARIWLAIHLVPIALALALGSWLPVLLVGPLPTMYGAWFSILMGLTQHAGLAENVLDHRLNSRTVYMNPVFRFLYWNMNYHVEHHMFPMVPYHRLPDLHARMKDDCPEPYPSTWAAYREIVPALVRQLRDPEWFVERELPPSARPYRPEFHGEVIRAADRRRDQENGRCRLDPRLLDRRHRRGGRRPLRPRRPHLRDLPFARRRVLRHRRPLHPRAGAPRGRAGHGLHHRVPEA